MQPSTLRLRSAQPAAKAAKKAAAAKAHVAAAGAGDVYRAPFPPYAIVTPRYIYWPPGSVAPAAAPAPATDDCTTSGNGCTEDQLCEFWGMNCPASPPPAPAALSDTQSP